MQVRPLSFFFSFFSTGGYFFSEKILSQSDTKIFRDLNALSRLSHRNIVPYYTTCVETSELQKSTVVSDDSSAEFVDDDGCGDGMTSVPSETNERHLPINRGFCIF